MIESVREDLKYLKESMFLKPEVKQRESLLPSVKENTTKPRRTSRKLLGKAKNTANPSKVLLATTEEGPSAQCEDSTTSEASEISKEPSSVEVFSRLSSNEPSRKLQTPPIKDRSDQSSIPSRAASKKSLPSVSTLHKRRAHSAKRESSPQAPLANLTMTFPGSNPGRASLAPVPSQSMSKAMATHLANKQQSKFALDTMSELNDVRALAEGFLVSHILYSLYCIETHWHYSDHIKKMHVTLLDCRLIFFCIAENSESS